MENKGDVLIVSSFQYLETVIAKSKGTLVMKLRCWQHGRSVLIRQKLASHWIKRRRGLKWNVNLFRRILTVALGNVRKWMLRLMFGLGEDTDTSCLTQQVLMDGPAVLHHSGCTSDPTEKGARPKWKCVVCTRHQLEVCLFVSFRAFHALSGISQLLCPAHEISIF